MTANPLDDNDYAEYYAEYYTGDDTDEDRWDEWYGDLPLDYQPYPE